MTNVSNFDTESLNPGLGPSRADDRRPPATADCPGTNRHRESTVNIGEGIRNSNQEARAAALRAPLRVKRRTGQTDVLRALENRHRWLLFAQHCYTCMRPEEACKLGKLCTYGKKTLKHVAQCKKDDCSYPRCRLLRPLLQHSRKCQSSTCAICVPVWNYIQKETLQLQQEQHQVLPVLQQVPAQQQQQQQRQREAIPQRPASSSAGPLAPRDGDVRAIAPTLADASLGQMPHQVRPTFTTTIAPTTTAIPPVSRPEPSAIGTAPLDKHEGGGSTCGAIGIGRAEVSGPDCVPGSAGATGGGSGRLSMSGTTGTVADACAGDGIGIGSGGAGGGSRGDMVVEKLAGSDRPEAKPTFPAHHPPAASNPQPHPPLQPQRQLGAPLQPLHPHQKAVQQEPLQQHPTVASTAHPHTASGNTEASLPHLRLAHGPSQAAHVDTPAVSEQGLATATITFPTTPAEPIPAANRTTLSSAPPLQNAVSGHPQPPTFHFVHSYPPTTSIGAYFPHLAAGPHLTAHSGQMAAPMAPTWWHFPGVTALPGTTLNGLPLQATHSATGGAALPGANGASSVGLPAGAANAMWPNAPHVRSNVVQYGTGNENTRPTDLSGGLVQPLGMPPPADRYGHAYRIPGVSAAAVGMSASVPLASTPVPTPMVLWTPAPPPQALPAAVGTLPPRLTGHSVPAPFPLNTTAAASAAAAPRISSGAGSVSLAAHQRALMPPVQLTPHAMLYGHGGLMSAAAAPGVVAGAAGVMPGGPGSSAEAGTSAALWSYVSR